MALVTRRAELLLRSARQRERLSRSVLAFDTRLQTADSRIAAATRVLTSTLAASLVGAALLSPRRYAALTTLVRAALLLSAVRRIGHSLTDQVRALNDRFRPAPR